MANRAEGNKDLMIQVAAWLFVNKTRDAKEIAKILKVGERTIHRYAETDTWNNVLQNLKYDGKRSFRVKEAGRRTELNRKIFMAKSFLDSAIFHEKTLHIVPADMAESKEEAESKLSDIRLKRKLVTHFLYAVVFELSIKIILEIEQGTSAPHHHNIFCLYKKLSKESRQKISTLYDRQVTNMQKLILECNRSQNRAGQIVNFNHPLQSLEDALKANEQTVKNFKYDGKFNGKSSALCSVMWTDDQIWALPRSRADAITFPKALLEYAISLED